MPTPQALGAAAGGALGAVLFPGQRIQGPRTKMLQVQNAAYGAFLPFGYGNFRTACTVIDQIPIQEVGTNVGKGGPPGSTQYSYYGWFGVAVCEGPILGIRKLWANGILIYDVSSTASVATLLASNTFAGKYLTIYLGDFAQLPDPTMQAWPLNGVGNTPAYRGMAYIVFRGLPLANFGNVLPSINAEVVTAGPASTPAKVWENLATGFGFNGATFTRAAFVTGFANGMVRGIAKTNVTHTSNDGNVYRLALATGLPEPNDVPTNFENNIASGSGFFLSPFGDQMGLVLPHAAGGSGVFSHYVGDTSAGNIVGHASSSAGASLYVSRYADAAIIGDILNSVTQPPGISGTWRCVSAFPCADWTHIAVVTKDHGGSGNYWLHVVAVNTDGSNSEVVYYQFDTPTNGAHASGFVGAWTDSWFDRPSSAMLESGLDSFWTVDGSGGGATGRYFKAAGGQISQVGVLVYSASVGVGWASIYADGGVMVYYSDNYAHCLTATALGAIAQVPLSAIALDLAEREGIGAGNINATALTDNVWGFAFDRQMNGRAALDALSPAFWFDAVESDMTLKFVKRSSASVATIPLADMATDSNGAAPLTITRGSEIELPTQINLTYYAVAANYQQGLQYARRISTSQADSIRAIDSAAVMDDNQAAVAAHVILWDALAGRTLFKFPTPYGTANFCYAKLEPTDVVMLVTDTESYLVRLIRKTEAAGRIDWEAVGCAPVYSQSAAGGAITAGQVVSGLMTTTAEILDIPPLRDIDGAAANLYIAMWGSPGWPGATLFKSPDAGITWVAGVSQGSMSTVGQATSALGNFFGGNIFDELNSVLIQLNNATDMALSSLPALSILNGGNLASLGNEIFQFKNAVLVSAGLYKLSGLLRGRLGTELGMAGHGVGERFVLLTGVLQIQPIPSSDIGAARLYQAVSNGQALGSGPQQTVIAAGRTLQCFSPVYLFATNNGVAGDIAIRWLRRDRLHWQWRDLVDIPMSESTEAYVVSIFSGASVVRTISVSGAGVQNATYTAAQQTTDFGAPFNPGDLLTFGVQQISAVTGPGVMAKVTLLLGAMTVPGAPTIGTATRGNAQATVPFTAPASNGGSAITSYTATSSPGGFTASGASSPLVVTGLTNGTAYTFTVTATNAIGTGAASAASNSVTPATVPGAPTIGTAVAGNAQADVAFTAPGSNGGSAITSYTATSSPGGFNASGASSPITVTGLSNGTAYTFTVTATNAVGTGSASSASNSVTPAGGTSTALLHFDGTNGSTTMTDVYANTWTARSGAALSTAQQKFGSASLLLNGSSDYIDTPSAPFVVGSGDFTYEAQIRPGGVSGSQVIWGKQSGGGFNGVLFFLNNDKLYCLAGNGSAWGINFGGATSLVANVWRHVALVRYGNVFTLYLDGVADGTQTGAGAISDGGNTQCIGQSGSSGAYFGGYIDEARANIGVAVYTANFTPPAAPFTF